MLCATFETPLHETPSEFEQLRVIPLVWTRQINERLSNPIITDRRAEARNGVCAKSIEDSIRRELDEIESVDERTGSEGRAGRGEIRRVGRGRGEAEDRQRGRSKYIRIVRNEVRRFALSTLLHSHSVARIGKQTIKTTRGFIYTRLKMYFASPSARK